MTLPTQTTAVALFNNRLQAHDAIIALREAGFPSESIGLFSRHGEATGLKTDPLATRWEEGMGIGAAGGALTGAGLGLAVVTGLLSPIGPVVAGGALVALLASAGAGATIGTVLGGLAGVGIPEDEYHYYEGELIEGKSMVTVDANERVKEAEAIIMKHGGHLRKEY
ncbi:hypothetical protein KIH39_19610 [Telmatocola sphagniphila]|uniref:General stress protein 17M-like domain-containing protein n=1 Tax=Telmatocola sphagniphila TaxID=1123043 RepID=A0A8E6B5T1_9BACT|nr:hypothetical protein [Telmatocola sphagniphila]QVL31038.1 hypothetical protein KIH39_19610 [Telmatocola sphagniphila]